MADLEERSVARKAYIGDSDAKKRARYIECRSKGHSISFCSWILEEPPTITFSAGYRCACGETTEHIVFTQEFHLPVPRSQKISCKFLHGNTRYKVKATRGDRMGRWTVKIIGSNANHFYELDEGDEL